MAAPQDLYPLDAGEAADLRRPGARRKGRVEPVDVKADIDRMVPHLRAHLFHERDEGSVPTVLGLNHAEALLTRPVEVVGFVSRGPQTDLDDPLRVDQALFDDAPERGAVGDFLAEHGVVDIGMGVDVHHPHGPMLLPHGPQDRQHDRMVAAQRQRHAAVGQNGIVGVLDNRDRFLQIEGVDRHVADVGHRQGIERRRAGRHVVGTNHRRFGANLARREAGAAAVRRANVERHTDETDIQIRRFGLRWKPHHRRRSGKARHLVAAQRLVVGLGHVAPSDESPSRPFSAQQGRSVKCAIGIPPGGRPDWSRRRRRYAASVVVRVCPGSRGQGTQPGRKKAQDFSAEAGSD